MVHSRELDALHLARLADGLIPVQKIARHAKGRSCEGLRMLRQEKVQGGRMMM